VRAQHGRDAAAQVVRQQVLVGRRLGMHIDDDDAARPAKRLQHAIGGAEGAIDGAHERPAHDAEDRHRGAVTGDRRRRLAAGGLGREVGRLAHAVVLLQHRDDVLLLVDVIAERDDINSRLA
jgi:hypothetical protein